MGVSIVMELPQKRWMVYFMENPIEMDDMLISFDCAKVTAVDFGIETCSLVGVRMTGGRLILVVLYETWPVQASGG